MSYSIILTWDTGEDRPSRIDFIDGVGRRTSFIRESDAQMRALDAARSVTARMRSERDDTSTSPE